MATSHCPPVLGGRGRSPEGVYNINKVTVYITTHSLCGRNPPPQATLKQQNIHKKNRQSHSPTDFILN